MLADIKSGACSGLSFIAATAALTGRAVKGGVMAEVAGPCNHIAARAVNLPLAPARACRGAGKGLLAVFLASSSLATMG